MTGDFVHLHVHSEYSLLDGCAPVRSIPEYAASLGMRAVALTDHGVMHGVVPFVKAARSAGVKPIIGCELYVHDDSGATGGQGAFHLTVLAKDAAGYSNLCLLSTLGHLSDRRGFPCVTKDQLIEHRRGLVVLSGCLAAEVPRLLAADRYDEARRAAGWFREWFGHDGYYLELMDHDLPVQRRVNEGLLRLHRDLGIDVVATRDVHYLTPEDAGVQEALHCIRDGRRLDDPGRSRPPGRLHFASPTEMAAAFASVPSALANTAAIAERCTFTLDLGAPRLPAFPGTEEHGGSAALLRSLVQEGVMARYGPEAPDSVWARVEHELHIIERTGFTDYFLIVWDLVRFARRAGIAVGPGRGSSASSVVAYALEITDVDPIAHGLVFERFLNPERVTMPDIDIDFCFERRHEVIEYAVKRYGADRVAHICTFGTLGARAAVRDVGRVLGLPPAEIDRVARLIPPGAGVTLSEALDEVPELEEETSKSQEISRLIELARKVEGLPRHLSVHAAGIVIAPEPLAATVPLCQSSEGALVTQYPGEDLESLGFLKMDLLGLRTLTVIDKAARLIAEERGIVLDLRRLPLDDEAVYQMLRRGEAEGVFQLETGMFQNLLSEVQPRRFDDLIAILALGRPGPMARLADFLRFRRGEDEPHYLHPALASILAESFGVMLYQEQVMQIAAEVAGYTPGEADLLRRAISKKLPEVMAVERRRFVEAATERGLEERAATQLFDEIAHFAEYGFPKSHSAAYARVAYQTAYLKARYPAEFMAALLSSVGGATERAGRYLVECRRLGLELAGPDVNESEVDFTVQRGKIRFGLAAVKHVGRALAAEIVARRASAPFRSLEDFFARMPSSALSRKAVESLARVGAFASTGTTRKAALAALDRTIAGRGWVGAGQRQFTLFGEEAVPKEQEGGGEELSLRQRIADEVELLGTYVTASPGELYREVLAAYQLPVQGRAASAVVGGVVLSVGERRGRDGRPLIWATLEDAAGARCALVLPPEVYHGVRELKPGAVVLVKGRLEEEEGAWKLLAQTARMLEGDPVEIEVTSADSLAQVRRMLAGQGGGRPVILAITGERARARLLLPPRYWLRSDESFAGQGVNEQ